MAAGLSRKPVDCGTLRAVVNADPGRVTRTADELDACGFEGCLYCDHISCGSRWHAVTDLNTLDCTHTNARR